MSSFRTTNSSAALEARMRDAIIAQNAAFMRQPGSFRPVQRRSTVQPVGRRQPVAARRTPGHTTRDTFEAPRTQRTTQTTGTTTQQRLVNAARNTALRMGGHRSTGFCARGVRRAIEQAMPGRTITGNANQTGPSLQRAGFRQVNMSLEQALRTPGAVMTWDRTPTRAGQRHGHIAVSLGDGRSSASDFIERDTLASSRGRTGLRVWLPPA